MFPANVAEVIVDVAEVTVDVAEVTVDDILGEGGKDVEKEGVDLKVNFFKGKPGNRDHLVSGI